MRYFLFLIATGIALPAAFGNALPQSLKTAYPENARGCTELQKLLPTEVFAPDSATYEQESNAFWSLAAALQPQCVFVPSSAKNLAKGIKALVQTNSTFSIRGGGHAPVTGIASTNHGVLIAASRFTETTIVSSREDFGEPYVRVGSGKRWGEVYDYLSPRGLNVLGGRVWGVGMGSALGGGMSFLSQQHGWMSNNVLNYELVTAAGDVLQVNKKTHPDLFWALKYGGNNYGIVTRFDLRTYRQGKIFALNRIFLGDATKSFMDAMTTWMLPGGGHEVVKGGIMPSTRYTPSTGQLDAAITAAYDQAIENPRAFENFTKIPAIELGSGIQAFHELVDTTKTQFGNDTYRWKWYSTSVKFGQNTMDIIVNTMVELAKERLPQLDGFVGVAEEPISKYYMQAARSNGGDPVDLDPAQGSFIVADYYVAYKDASDDAAVEAFLQELIGKVEAKSTAQGLYYPFYWLNTAGILQKPFALSATSVDRMRKVSRKYDPKGVFQTLVPGFKLSYTLDGE